MKNGTGCYPVSNPPTITYKDIKPMLQGILPVCLKLFFFFFFSCRGHS